MWEKCKELQEELVRMRRELHQIPELGGELPKTRAYVEEKLKELGIPFVENKTDSGLIATIKGEKRGRPLCSVQIWMPFRYRKPMRWTTYPDMKDVCMPADMIRI